MGDAKKFAKEILSIAFATPAALSLLAKLDSRLEFTPAIERIVLNFDALSKYLWEYFSFLINFPLTQYIDHLSLSFLLLLIMPILFHCVKNRRFTININLLSYKLHDITRWQIIIVALPVIYFTIIFDAYFIVIMVILASSTSSAQYLAEKYLSRKYNLGNETTKLIAALIGIAPLVVTFFVITYIFEKYKLIDKGFSIFLGPAFSNNPGLNTIADVLYILTLILLILIYVTRQLRSVAYAFLWATGVIAVNFVAGTLIPGIDAFLTKAGA